MMDTFLLPKELVEPNKKYFAHTCDGEGMSLENIHTGYILIFEETSTLENGDIGCFEFDGNKKACKKYFYDERNKVHILEFCDLKQMPIVISEDKDFRILGKLIYVFSKRN